jgi:hypothetical protein
MSAALIAAGVGSASGLTALAVTRLRGRTGAGDPETTRAAAPDEKETPDEKRQER